MCWEIKDRFPYQIVNTNNLCVVSDLLGESLKEETIKQDIKVIFLVAHTEVLGLNIYLFVSVYQQLKPIVQHGLVLMIIDQKEGYLCELTLSCNPINQIFESFQ